MNICGNVCYYGSWTPELIHTAPLHLRDSIVAYQPVIVTINEICLEQASILDTLLSQAGYAMSVIHHQTILTDDNNNRILCHYGNAILVKNKNSVGSILSTQLPIPPGGEPRAMTCLDAYIPIGVRACVTHLINGTTTTAVNFRNYELSTIEPIVNPYVAAFVGIIVGGDFNVSPNGDGGVLSKIYASAYGLGGFGGFKEVEGTRAACVTTPVSPCQATLGNEKVDYMFIDKYN